MSKTQKALFDDARKYAQEKANDISRLEGEILQIKTNQIKLDASLNLARLAQKRALDYRPLLGGGFLCPRCWIDTEARNALRSVPEGKNYEVFKCSHCETEFEIDMSF